MHWDETHSNIVESLRPFMSNRAAMLADALMNVHSVLKSETGQSAIDAVKKLTAKEASVLMEITPEKVPGKEGKPFLLFLILILLLLSDDGILQADNKNEPTGAVILPVS